LSKKWKQKQNKVKALLIVFGEVNGMKSKILIGLTLILLILLPQVTSFAMGSSSKGETDQQVSENPYHAVLNQWKNEGLGSPSKFEKAIDPSHFIATNKKDLLSQDKSKGYGNKVSYWRNKDSVTFQVVVNEEGLYELTFDYYPLGNGISPIEGAVKVNGIYQYSESQRIGFPVQWKNKSNTLKKDRYGDDIVPDQEVIRKWTQTKAQDANYIEDQPLKFHLVKGKNTITLENTGGQTLLGNVYVTSPTQTPSYKNYLESHKGDKPQTTLSSYEAEKPLEKSSSYLRPIATSDPSASPYDSRHDLLNTFGGDSWATSGQSASWKIDVKKDGLYHLSFKVLQNNSNGAPVYRTLLIDGKVPFSEVNPYAFNYDKNWENVTLSNSEGHPYYFYLSQGTHVITLVADASPMEPVISQINEVTKGIDDLALSIEKLTGNQTDQSRDWNIADYIPNISSELNQWSNRLDKQAAYLKSLSEGNSQSKEVASLQQSVDKLRNLAKTPNDIP
jgi:hypothetical protein